MRERLHFQRRGVGDDGLGHQVPSGPFATVFTVSAAMRPLQGTEAVMASRLQGRQPYVVTVRKSSQTAPVTAAWRLVDARNADRVFAIAAPPADPDGRNAWLEILVTEGGVS